MRDYTLRFTPYGPPRLRISFTLNSVDPECRADASQEPVSDLRPIYLCEDVIESAHKLRQIRIESDRRCFGTVECKGEEQDRLSPMASPGEEASNEEQHHPNTQMAYGTQVVHRLRTPSKNPRRGTDPMHKVTDDKSDKAAKLLGLLKPRTAIAAPSKSVLATGSPRGDTEGAPSGPRAMRESLPSSGHSNVSSTFLSPAARVDAPKAPSAGGFTRTSTNRSSTEGLVPPTDRMQSTRLPPSYPRQNTSGKPSVPVKTNVALEDLDPEWLKDTCRTDGCGRVPGPQQKLLSSWQKQRAGTSDRFPHVNVPIHLFNAFKHFKLNAASSDSESSDEGDSSDSDTDSPGQENTADGGTENRMGSTAHVPARENDGFSDGGDEPLTSWPSSPVVDSPNARFKPGPILPPDSSLPDQSTASQREPEETSLVQEARRVADFQSSGEENIAGPHSSPPAVPDGDDSDMDMEMDLPRGLEEGNSAHTIPPAATAIDEKAAVLVRETPYPKEKESAPPPNVLAAQAQQQTSSRTSKDTSSTSIIYGTYHEPSSSMISVLRGTDAVPQSTALVTSYNGHEENVENVESIDVPMEDANDEPAQLSLDFEDERQHANPAVSPLNPLDDLDSRLEPEQPHVEVGISPLVSPGLTPVSSQRSHSRAAPNGTAHGKRKFEHSPSKRTRLSSKRDKFPRFAGFPYKERRTLADDIEVERKAHYENYIIEMTAAQASNISDYSAKPGAHPISSHTPQEANRGRKDGFESLQTRSMVNAEVGERDGNVTNDHQDVDIDQTHQQSRESSPHSTAGGAELQTPLLPHSSKQSRAPSELHEDVDMEIDDTEAEESDVESTRVENAEGYEMMRRQSIRSHDRSQLVQAQSRTSDTASKTAPRVTTPKEARPDMGSSKSETIFEMFKATYPAYTGDVRHFLGQCKQMEKLDEQDKMVPKWQWDDFIIRNRSDYRDYANECLDNGEDAEPYYRFYKDNIRDTLYTGGIIANRKTLVNAIREVESGTAARATAASVTGTAAKVSRSPSFATSSQTENLAAKSSTVKAPTAKVSSWRALERSHAAVEGSSPVADVQRKARRSLPPAFSKTSGVKTSTAQRASKERPRQSLEASSSRGASSLAGSDSFRNSTPVKQSNRLSTPSSTSTGSPRAQRTSRGSHVSTEPTGDPYRDFVFAMGRAKSFTGSDSVGPSSTHNSDGG